MNFHKEKSDLDLEIENYMRTERLEQLQNASKHQTFEELEIKIKNDMKYHRGYYNLRSINETAG